jgi:hypothetical protein
MYEKSTAAKFTLSAARRRRVRPNLSVHASFVGQASGVYDPRHENFRTPLPPVEIFGSAALNTQQ